MQYEIRIWKDPTKIPDIEPKEAAGRLQAIVDSTADKLNEIATAAGGGRFTGQETNPDILIDKNAGGEDAIKSVEISYVTKEVETTTNNKGLNVRGLIDNNNVVTITKRKVRVIKIDIKGNLYLPLKEDGLTSAAKSLIGAKQDENKIRNTILLSQWASVRPEDDAQEHFYRGIIVSVLTKAGDFRVITAKKVYVDSYTENYEEGEFGTFSLSLIEKVDANVDFKVAGLGQETLSIFEGLGKAVKSVAEKAAVVGAVAAGIGAVGKTVTETVEKFTGENAATRWIKYGFDATSGVGNAANSASNIAKNPKDVKTWTTEVTNINKDANKLIQQGVDTKEDIPLAQMEKMYLGVIQKNPEKYEEYLKASAAEKYKLLEDASKTARERSAITKDMEQSVAAEKKLSADKTEIKNLKKEYLDLIKADPELYDKYNKATTEEKLNILQEQKKNFDDIQNKYLPLIKADPQKFDEYNKATTDKQLEMLEEAKQQHFEELEKKYLDEIKKDPKKLKEYNKADTDKKIAMLEEVKKASEGNENADNKKPDDEKIDENKPKSTSTTKTNLTDKINSAAQKKNGNGNGNGTK